MEKQKKNKKKISKYYLKRIKKTKKFFKFIKRKKLCVYSSYVVNNIVESKAVRFSISVKITPNNMFCTLISNKDNKILLSKSSGSYKINLSKKLLKYYHKIILSKFFLDVEKCKKESCLIINLISPLKLRKSIFRHIVFNFNKTKLYFNFKPLKLFNGCRPKKKKRKKQKSLRIK